MGSVKLSGEYDDSLPPPKVIDVQWGKLVYPYIRTDEMNKEISRFGEVVQSLNGRIQFLQKAVVKADEVIKYYKTPWIKRKVVAVLIWIQGKLKRKER